MQKEQKGLKNNWQNSKYRGAVTDSIRTRSQSPEHKRKMSEFAKAQWEDPKYRERMIQSASEVMTANWQNPEFRERKTQSARDIMTANWQNPEFRERKTESTKAQWDDPEFKEKVTELNRARSKDPEFIRKRSEFAKAQWENPEYRERITEFTKAQWENPEYRERKTESSKAQWEDPEFRKLMEIVYTARKIAEDMHPECNQVRKDIAKDFSGLGLPRILAKINARKELTEVESTIYRTYCKKCNEVKFNVGGEELGIQEIIGRCQKEILTSWGFREKDRDIYKIAENIGILNS